MMIIIFFIQVYEFILFFLSALKKEWSKNILYQLCYAEVPQVELRMKVYVFFSFK